MRARALAVSLLVLVGREALGYRPFDSTDADVAPPGELELELGPVGFLGGTREQFLTLPSLVLNAGLARGWELVLQGRHLLLLGSGAPRARLVDTGLFLKGVLRRGSLQEGRGPSVALEAGPLLPTFGAEDGLGATATLIVSQRWAPLTLHVNLEATLTRAGHFDLFGGVIVEGPARWRVRPVAELFVEHDVSFAWSGLAGAIWRVKESLSFDLALRVASVDRETVYEARCGLTWATPIPRVLPR